MPIEIKKRNPVTHSIKVALGTISIFIVLGFALKVTDKSKSPSSDDFPKQSIHEILGNDVSPPTIKLHVIDTSLEKNWVEALQQQFGGESEVSVEYGRVDLLTDNYAIEVDYLGKWKEGVGQALHYSEVSGKIPCLALIINNEPLSSYNTERIKYIHSFSQEKGIKLLLLSSDRKTK